MHLIQAKLNQNCNLPQISKETMWDL